MSKKIKNVPQLAPVAQKLQELGYRTLKSVVMLNRAVPPALLDAYFAPYDLDALLGDVNFRIRNKVMKDSYGGVDLANIPSAEPYDVIPEGATPLPPRLDLSWTTRKARQQAQRATCVAFAAAGVLEAAAVKLAGDGDPNAGPRYSPQFIYWDCKQRSDPEREGTSARVAFDCLKEDGVCSEEQFPYVGIKSTPEGGPDPSAAVKDSAGKARIKQYVRIDPKSVEQLRRQLHAGYCIALSFPVFTSWKANSELRRSGRVVLPVRGEAPARLGHCACLTGYRLKESVPGGGEFFFRNSWGADFGKKSKIRNGFGTIPFAYVEQYAVEAYSLVAASLSRSR